MNTENEELGIFLKNKAVLFKDYWLSTMFEDHMFIDNDHLNKIGTKLITELEIEYQKTQ